MKVLKNVPRSTINYYLQELKNQVLITLKGNPNSWSGANKAYWELVKAKK